MKNRKQFLLVILISVLFSACSSTKDFKPLYKVQPVIEEVE